MPADDRGRVTPPIARLDPGWLFMLAGLGLIAAAVLIPAFDQMEEVRWQRERALALEANRLDRLGRYEQFLGALERGEPALVKALAASQLNQIPAESALLLDVEDPGKPEPSLFASLEPGPVQLPERVRVESRLGAWATNPRTQPWLTFAGVVLLLIGLMPTARARR